MRIIDARRVGGATPAATGRTEDALSAAGEGVDEAGDEVDIGAEAGGEVGGLACRASPVGVFEG